MVTIDTIFSPTQRLQYILNFEAALGRALTTVGIVPASVAGAIAAECDASRFDLAEIAREAVAAGNDVIPTVERLRSAVARHDAGAASYVHWGATSQDAIDTALVLQLRDARALFDAELDRLGGALARLTLDHASTPIVGRTWLQHAPPTTFGLKAAGWLDAIHRHRVRLLALWESALVVQFGGAVGTLAALGPEGPAVADALSVELGLGRPAIPWHATRDRVAHVATTMGLLTGTLGKIARDVSLLSQSEVDEAREGRVSGRGRSSTMPHKQNPVGCANILGAAIRVPGLVSTALSAMIQEHERGLGGWQAEWETIPQICILTFGALEQTTLVVSGLEIDRDRMAANLELTHGFIFAEALMFALAPKVGRAAANALIQSALRRATEQSKHLRDVVIDDPEIGARLSRTDIERLFDARHYLGAAEAMAKSVAEITPADHRARERP